MNTKTIKSGTRSRSDASRTPGKPAPSQSPAPKRQQARPAASALPVLAEPVASKQARLIARLEIAPGASIAQLVELTGWQPHSIRGVISGILRRKYGFDVRNERCPETGERLYRIIGTAAA